MATGLSPSGFAWTFSSLAHKNHPAPRPRLRSRGPDFPIPVPDRKLHTRQGPQSPIILRRLPWTLLCGSAVVSPPPEQSTRPWLASTTTTKASSVSCRWNTATPSRACAWCGGLVEADDRGSKTGGARTSEWTRDTRARTSEGCGTSDLLEGHTRVVEERTGGGGESTGSLGATLNSRVISALAFIWFIYSGFRNWASFVCWARLNC
jgi:hypothetical protein